MIIPQLTRLAIKFLRVGYQQRRYTLGDISNHFNSFKLYSGCYTIAQPYFNLNLTLFQLSNSKNYSIGHQFFYPNFDVVQIIQPKFNPNPNKTSFYYYLF